MKKGRWELRHSIYLSNGTDNIAASEYTDLGKMGSH